MSSLMLSIVDGHFSYGNHNIFSNLSLYIHDGDRVCLIGRNGSGKSSLQKIIAGIHELDKGELHIRKGLNIGYLPQDNIIDKEGTIYEYVLEGYENIEETKYLADIILEKLDLEGSRNLKNLSGGRTRRVALAKALIGKPDLLLLDEPTNHLDITAIEWLQEYILSNNITLLCISHDREFLKNVSNRIFWIDRGEFHYHNKGYKDFDNFMEQVYLQEEAKLRTLTKKLEAENHWLAYGVTARRKRNQRRLKELFQLREKLKQEKSRNKLQNSSIKLPALTESQKSKLVLELDEVTLGYNDVSPPKIIFRNISLRIMQGEKIGLIGKNGAGKTSFLKMIMKEIKPLSGKIQLGPSVTISYVDQARAGIDLDKTLWENLCPDGGDTIYVSGKPRHVGSHLKQFLFRKDQYKAKASTLSGGELNRLLLAKELANPGNFLILDEPTNDLDMDSLEMLEEMLSDFKGTILIVSHDRSFLDGLVTRTIVLDGENVDDFIGGYTDYIKETGKRIERKNPAKPKATPKETVKVKTQNKLSYKDMRDLEIIPEKISAIEMKKKEIEKELSDENLYNKEPEKFIARTQELEKLQNEIAILETRYLEVLEMQEKLN